MNNEELAALAERARENAYSPYSGYTVGAALLCADGRVFCGCNVENASFSATCCAERVAFFRALSEGERAFRKIAVVGGRRGEKPDSFFMPCGVCRQVMREFCGDNFEIAVGGADGIRTFTLAALLPAGFGADAMRKKGDTQ